MQEETNEEEMSNACSFIFLMAVTDANCIFYYPELHFHRHQLLMIHSDAAISLLMGTDNV